MTMSREGRPSGEAYVEMETDDDIEKACKKDRDHMGRRYIEGTCEDTRVCVCVIIRCIVFIFITWAGTCIQFVLAFDITNFGGCWKMDSPCGNVVYRFHI